MRTPNEQLDGLDSDLAAAGQMIESLRQQLALATQESSAYREGQDRACEERDDHIKREVMLRDALHHLWNERTPDSYDEAGAALAATADLDGLILCHAEPVGGVNRYGKNSSGKPWHGASLKEDGSINLPSGTPLFVAWEPKP